MSKFVSPGDLEAKLLRKRNKFLDIVRKFPGTSRQECAMKMRVSTYSMTKLVPSLIESGMVTENRTVSDNVKLPKGRPSCPLHIRGEYAYFAGIDIEASNWRFVIIDFSGELLYSKEEEFHACASKKKYITLLNSLLCSTISEYPELWKKVTSIGVGAPGFLDLETGTVLNYEVLPGFKNIPLVDLYRKQTDKKVFINDNVSNLAVYDLINRPETEKNIMLHVAVRSGVSSALSLHGQIFSGSSSKAGEIGLFPVTNGKFLQDIVGLSALHVQLPDLPAEFWDGNPLVIDSIFSDINTKKIITEAFEVLARIISGITCFIDPDEIILYSTLFSQDNLIQKLLEETFSAYRKKQLLSPIQLRFPEHAKFNAAVGAALFAIDSKYKIS
jgi:predicted NBD/HSP70 family sugar kinase